MKIFMVRNGQKVWPTCPTCGCRLEFFENSMFYALRHFGEGLDKRDARGCKCPDIDLEVNTLKGEISHFGYC